MRSMQVVVFVAASLALAAASPVRAQQVLNEIGGDARAEYEAGERALLACDYAEARRDLDRAIALVPDYPRSYDLLLTAERTPTDIQATYARFAALAKAFPDRAAYVYAYGRTLRDLDEQERAFSKVVALAPDAPWGYFALAYVAKRKGQFEKALELYAKAAERAPDEPAIKTGVVTTLLLMPGREREARERLGALLAAWPQTSAAEGALAAVVAVSRPDERPALADRYLALYPNGPASGRIRSDKVEALGLSDPDAAVALAREYLRTGASGLRSGWFLAISHGVDEKGRVAIDALAEEVDSWPETDPYVLVNLAFLYRDQPDYEARGEEIYARAERLAARSPENPDEAVGAVSKEREMFRLVVLSRRDPAAAAVRARSRMAEADPEERSYLFGYMLADAKRGGPKALEALVRRTLADDELDAGTLAYLAQSYDARTFDPALGAELFSRTLDRYLAQEPVQRIPSFVVMLRAGLAETRRRTGDRAGALASLLAIDSHARDARTYRALARVYADGGDAACELDALARATAAAPDEANRAALVEAAKRAGKTEADADALVARVREESAYPAPDFTLDALGGGKVTLSRLRGKVVLVNFWFPGCGPCRQELPQLQKLYEAYRDRGLDVLAIDMTSQNAEAAAFVKQAGLTFPSLVNGPSGTEDVYGTRSAPTTYVVDRAGRVVYVETGFSPEHTIATIRSIVEPLLAKP